MRKYNISNYVRYKKEVEDAVKRVRKPIDGDQPEVSPVEKPVVVIIDMD